MSISKSRSLVLPLFLLAMSSGVACSEGMDPMPGTGGGPGAGGALGTGGAMGTGGTSSGGAISTGGAAAGGAASGGAAAGGAASGGTSSGGAAAGGGASGGAAAGGAAAGGGPGTGGDTGSGGSGPTVAFSEVTDIMAERCAVCHTAPGSSAKPNFSSPEAIEAAFQNTPAIAQCGNNELVTPGSPEDSALAMLINGACTAGGQGAPAQMPMMAKIPDAEIQTIEDWISSGAPGPE